MIELNKKLILFIPLPSTFVAYMGTKVNAGVQHYPLLSFMYLSAYVKKYLKFQTCVADLGITDDPWRKLPDLLEKVRPSIVCMTCTTPLFYEMRLASFIIKAVLGPEVKIVIGGVHATALPQEALIETIVDYVVYGEGEITFKEICEERPLENILGLVYRADKNRRINRSARVIINDIVRGKPLYEIEGMEDDANSRDVRVNPPRPYMSNQELDQLPFADMELYDYYLYKNPLLISREYPMIQMETSRGCPYHCDFCSAEDEYRVMSPERVVDEMQYLKRCGIKELRIIDDQFATDMKRAKAIAQLMAKRNLKFAINFANGVRVDRWDREMLLLWKDRGLYQLGIGFESGDQITLDGMQKGLKDGVAAGIKAMSVVRSVQGLEVVGFFMIGAKADSEKSINQTIAYAKLLQPDYAKVTISTPFPGTRLYAELESRGLIYSKRWDLYNIHRTNGVFGHPNGLTQELLSFYYNLFYTEYYVFNLPYLRRRLMRSIKNGSIFTDIWYAGKTFFPNLIPGDPRSSFNLRPICLWHKIWKKIYKVMPDWIRNFLIPEGKDIYPENNQIVL